MATAQSSTQILRFPALPTRLLRKRMIVKWALSIRFIPMYARLVRGEMFVERVKEYAVAAQAIGSAQTRLVFRHLLPNSLSPLITQSTTNISWAVLNTAGLSFLGVGMQPPTSEWG
jgi:peptide/nickel transport system permease protein